MQHPNVQKHTTQVKPKVFNEELDLFTGAFNKYNFVNKEPKQNIGEQLPQINVKPLDIVEPQMLGKTSLVSKTTASSQNMKDSIPNDFQPKNLKKNNSEKQLVDTLRANENIRTSEGTRIENRKIQKEPAIPSIQSVKWKTIFKSQTFPISTFDIEYKSVDAPWLLSQSPGSSQPPSRPDPIPDPKKHYDSNISTGHSNNESNQSNQLDGGSSFSQQTPKAQENIVKPKQHTLAPAPTPAPTPAPVPTLVPTQPAPKPAIQPEAPKEPVTIQSIFKKYRLLNKTVTKIVHKKNKGNTEKWVYFADGSSVLEDPGNAPPPAQIETPTNTAPAPVNNFQQSGQNPNFQQQNNASGIQPSNVYFYDHSNLVAEFDPENPNNIAMTLYEITTLQQKHLYCKYFEPSPDPKFMEMEAIIDYKSPGNPSVYHQLDLLNDEELLKPKKVLVQKTSGQYWTKSLRKSNKRIISKKNRPISQQTNVISNSSS